MDTLKSLLCCLGMRRRQGQLRQPNDGRRSGKDHSKKKSCLRATRRSLASRFTRSARDERLETPGPRRRWPRLRGGMNRVFARSPPPRGIMTADWAVAVEPRPTTDDATATAVQVEDDEVGDRAGGRDGFSSRDHAAAATIQAHFRGHLARQAFRALRSLVRLQAFARGSYVRKQANVAIRFMKVLVRLQVRVRARQLLSTRPGNDR